MFGLAADCLDLTVEALAALGIALGRLRWTRRDDPVAVEARSASAPRPATGLSR